MPASYQELKGSPTVTVDIISGEAQGNRSFKVAWADYGQFIYDLSGQWVTNGTTSTFVPASINFPGWPQLIVNNISVKPFMEETPASQTFTSLTSATNTYPDAQVDVTYKPRQQYNDSGAGHHPGVPNVPNGTILEVSSKLATEALTTPGFGLYAVTGGGNQLLGGDTTGYIRIACNSFSLRWSRVPQPPWTSMRAIEGLINAASFLGYSASTVLFEGADRDASFQINGSDLWTIVYNFKSRSQSWNQIYLPKSPSGSFGGWFEIVNSVGDPLFDSGSFTPLFSFGS